ncbi:MAG: FAD-dependent oxidoreductase [Pseudomonadota bacterium]
MRKVVVVGAGPAGLGAAEALLDRGRGEVDVRVLTLEPYLGGSAASFTTPDGRVVEQGQHIMAGFYREMRRLLARADAPKEKTTFSNRGHLRVWEDRDQATHDLHFGASSVGALFDGLRYSGLSFGEKLGFGSFMARMIAHVIAGVPESWDDQCLTSLCLEMGLPATVAATNVFRTSREAQFNYPGEISAYSVMHTLRELARDYSTSEVRFPAGSMSDIWWEPIGRRIEALGGRIERGWELTGIEHDGRQVRGLVFDRLDPLHTPAGFLEPPFPRMSGGRQVVRDFDHAILAIPAGSMQALLEADPGLAGLPGWGGIRRLQTVAPMGLHVWHREPVTKGPRTLVAGLLPPLAIALDNKPFNPAYRDNPRFGSVLHFVGQETGFEDTPDEDLLRRALGSLQRVEGYERIGLDGVLAWRLVRDHAPHRRYWLSAPGSMKLKPFPRGPLEGLWMAGDWVRSPTDFPCMETAVRSGRLAADLVLKAAKRELRLAGRAA